MNDITHALNRAVTCHQGGRIEEAISLYLKILPLQRDNDELLFMIGTACCQAGRLEDGLFYLRKAARLNPRNFHIVGNLGAVLIDLRRFDEAIINYNKALSLNPSFAEAFFGRANALIELKRFSEAVADYDRCLALAPSFAIAYCNKGKALLGLNQNEASLISFEKAIALEPRLVEAYCNRANVLKRLGRYHAAIESYEVAIRIKQDIYGANLDLAKIYYEIGRQSEGNAILERVVGLAPEFFEALWVMVVSRLPLIPKNVEEIQSARAAFEQGLNELGARLHEVANDEAYRTVGAAQPFYIAYHEIDNKLLLSKYGTFCSQLMAQAGRKNVLPLSKKSSKLPLRVGIISNHIYSHSVWDALTRGWVKKLDRALFNVFFFYTGSIVDEETLYAKTIAAGFFQCGSDLNAWVDLILREKIDVLIFPEIGMDPMTIKLASMRLAPVQVASWGHPETTGLPTVDYYLSAELMESEGSERFYSEQLVKLPNLGCYIERPDVIPDLIKLEDFGLDASLPLLICAGTPFKYQPQFDRLLVEISRAIGPCQFIFFTHSIIELSDLLKARMEAEFLNHGLNSRDYLHFLPWQPKSAFYSLLRKSDVYLDTIGFSGFNSALQALDCDLPVVTREGKFMRGRLASGLLKRIGLDQLIAENEKEYVSLVVKLIRDRQFNQNVRKEIKSKLNFVFEDNETIKDLEKFFIEAYNRTQEGA